MNGIYKDKIKVVADDKMCFPVDPKTLEPVTSSIYDPYAWSDPDPEPLETITISELYRRQDAIRSDEARRRNAAYQLRPMAIFTRSANGKLVRLPDAHLPIWMHEHLRQYDRLKVAIHPEPSSTFNFVDTQPYPYDTVNGYEVNLEQHYRCEFGRKVLDGAVITDPEQAERFIRCHQGGS
ncbi:hypothetical protein [Aeromonas jandaei]|uniref:hypothetical protein n=1 Tax=Aeromonas jandaei TaxID=650 RepID=UPI001C04D34B|nr:hypothetical protein [Aeromonas jandaei]QWL64891.1 hypothetical protein HQ398_00905 [Aeromonas jandaei]